MKKSGKTALKTEVLKRRHAKRFWRGGMIKKAKNSDTALKTLKVFKWFILALNFGQIRKEEIEAARRALRRLCSRKERIYVRAYPFIALTKKPLQSRMGRGKGAKSGEMVCPVKPGKILLTLETRRRFKKSFCSLIGSKIQTKLSLDIKLCSEKNLYYS